MTKKRLNSSPAPAFHAGSLKKRPPRLSLVTACIATLSVTQFGTKTCSRPAWSLSGFWKRWNGLWRSLRWGWLRRGTGAATGYSISPQTLRPFPWKAQHTPPTSSAQTIPIPPQTALCSAQSDNSAPAAPPQGQKEKKHGLTPIYSQPRLHGLNKNHLIAPVTYFNTFHSPFPNLFFPIGQSCKK